MAFDQHASACEVVACLVWPSDRGDTDVHRALELVAQARRLLPKAHGGARHNPTVGQVFTRRRWATTVLGDEAP